MSAGDHTKKRPDWDCARCGEPWPCDPAREQLASEMRGTYLTLFMSVDMIDAARDQPKMPPSELYERFISWTRGLGQLDLDAAGEGGVV